MSDLSNKKISPAPENRQAWLTPLWLLLKIQTALGIAQFCRDMASPGAGLSNVLADIHHVEEPGNPKGGGLSAPWKGRVLWVNPPYADPYPWCHLAAAAVENGDAELVIALLPVRPDAAWHKDNVTGRAHLLFLDRRVKFEVEPGVPGGTAMFSAQLIIWGGTRSRVDAIRAAFPDADFRPAPHYWQPLPRGQGIARTRVAKAVRLSRGGARRRLDWEGR